jgi:PhnB protein
MKTKTNCAVQTHLNFEGRCEEAIEFYRRALAAEVDFLMRLVWKPSDQRQKNNNDI